MAICGPRCCKLFVLLCTEHSVALVVMVTTTPENLRSEDYRRVELPLQMSMSECQMHGFYPWEAVCSKKHVVKEPLSARDGAQTSKSLGQHG